MKLLNWVDKPTTTNDAGRMGTLYLDGKEVTLMMGLRITDGVRYYEIYYAYPDGTIDSEPVASYDTQDQTAMQAFSDQWGMQALERSYIPYYQHVAETGDDFLGKFDDANDLTRNERFQIHFSESPHGVQVDWIRYKTNAKERPDEELCDYLHIQRLVIPFVSNQTEHWVLTQAPRTIRAFREENPYNVEWQPTKSGLMYAQGYISVPRRLLSKRWRSLLNRRSAQIMLAHLTQP